MSVVTEPKYSLPLRLLSTSYLHPPSARASHSTGDPTCRIDFINRRVTEKRVMSNPRCNNADIGHPVPLIADHVACGWSPLLVVIVHASQLAMTTIPARLAQVAGTSKTLDEARRRSINAYRAWWRSVR